MIFTGRDIDQLRTELHIWNGTTPFALGAATRKSAREARRLAAKRDDADNVLDAFVRASERGADMSSEEAACKSVAAILLPWILQWLFSGAMKAIVEWLWNRTQKEA